MNLIVRIAVNRKRLALGVVFGIFCGVVLAESAGIVFRALVGWNAGVYAYLAMIWFLMMRADAARVRQLARLEDQTAIVVLALVCIGAIMSMAAIVLELANAKSLTGSVRLVHFVLTGTTVLGSWLLVHTVFTLHYAHMFYRGQRDTPMLGFADGETQPDFWDFLYFSFTIAVAQQTADVVLRSRAMRRAVLMHSILSFLFNTSILAFSVNIAASLVGP